MRTMRFRVRTLMAAVGVVALLIWGAMMGLRSYDYYRRASTYSLLDSGEEVSMIECKLGQQVSA